MESPTIAHSCLVVLDNLCAVQLVGRQGGRTHVSGALTSDRLSDPGVESTSCIFLNNSEGRSRRSSGSIAGISSWRLGNGNNHYKAKRKVSI